MSAQICVLVEGAYPYVSGGVSTWLQGLITNLPDLSFSVVHVGSVPDPSRERRYKLPDNVVEFHELYLHNPPLASRRTAKQRSAEGSRQLRELHEALATGDSSAVTARLREFCAGSDGEIPVGEALKAPDTWDLLVDRYRRYGADSSFLDYFWTFRYTHLPLFNLLEARLPDADLYHSVSAGYNGFLGAIAQIRTGRPYLLTEHGIYTKEREIELAQSDWPISQPQAEYRLSTDHGLVKEWWMNMFRFMTRLCYDTADSIISITAVNQADQLAYGAEPGKLRVIPNGVPVERFAGLNASADRDAGRFVVCFVGRVVPIKDVKTFLRSVRIARATIPGLVAYVVGPTDEDEEYVRECRSLVETLDLSKTVRFTGSADVRDYYRQADVVVLTSLSEAQPLALLEASCAGIPIVASDAGACAELLFGTTAEDQALGPSGLLTRIASPEETASGIIRLWREPDLRHRMGRAGAERVRRFYQEDQLYDAYRSLYLTYLKSSRATRAS